jgi:hypothetical protein
MAWMEVCKIEAVNHVDKKIEEGAKVRDALKLVSKESGIPVSTLNKWKYPRELVAENGHKLTKRKPSKISQRQAWKTAEKNLDKLVKKMMERCEVPADIPESIKLSFKGHVEILKSFVDDL